MAKFHEVFPDIQEKFTNFTNNIDSLREVNIKILANNSLKEIGKVIKANDLLKHMTQEDVIIILNEEIFEQLEEESQTIIIEELIARIYFDFEKSKLSIINPDIIGFSGVIQKYGFNKYYETKLLIKELFSKEEAEDAENNVPVGEED